MTDERAQQMDPQALVAEYLDTPEYKALVERYQAHFAKSPGFALDGKAQCMWVGIRSGDTLTELAVYPTEAVKGIAFLTERLVERTEPMHLDTYLFADFLNRKTPKTVFVEKGDNDERPIERWYVGWPDDAAHPLRVAMREVGDRFKADLLAMPEVRTLAEKAVAELRDAFLSGRMAEATRKDRVRDLYPSLSAAVDAGLTDEQILEGVKRLLAAARQDRSLGPFGNVLARIDAERNEAIKKLIELPGQDGHDHT